jgi:murein DD-endopeptidase MepM/ murein hydrolase activator NlpD
VANYNASVNLLIGGTSNLDKLVTRITQLEGLIERINATPIDLSKTAGRGAAADRLGVAQRRVQQLRDDYLELGEAQKRWQNGSRTGSAVGGNATTNQLRAQSDLLQSIANNSKLASAQFKEMTIAAALANAKANEAGRQRLSVLAEAFSGQGSRSQMSNVRGNASLQLVDRLVAAYPTITQSEAALNAYKQELGDIQQLLPIISNEYKVIENRIAQVNKVLADSGLRGQVSSISPQAGPATSLSSVAASEKRLKYQEKINDQLAKMAAIETRIEQAALSGTQKQQLRNNLDQAAEALGQHRLRDAVRITSEIDRQRMSLERLNRASQSKTPTTSPVDQELANRKRLNHLINSSALLEQGLLTAKAKGLDVTEATQRIQQLINNLNRSDLTVDKQQLDLIDEILNGLRSELQLKKAIANTSIAEAKAAQSGAMLGPGSPGGERAFRQAGEKRTAEQKAARAQKLESVALGVGFPLMFGAGPASVAGSLAGSFAGSGFGGQILGGALGAAIDKLGVAAIDTGKSLTYPIEGFEKLKEASLFASREQEYYISKLIETGRVAEATAVIQAEMIKKIGVRGVNDLAALGESSIQLSKAWAEFNLQLQAALAGPMAGLLVWLTKVVGSANAVNEATNVGIDLQRQGQGEAAAALATKVSSIEQKKMLRSKGIPVGGSAEQDIQEIKKLTEYYKQFVKTESVKTKLSPEDREKAIKAAEQQADTIKDAYRTGFRLQQQGLDLQRQGSDLQRRVAQDIYNKQQEILRLQVDNDRQRKQVAIEMVDLEYRRRISNEEGRVAAVLEAEAALMKTKAEGEANIEAKKRLLELDIDKQKRETENYIFELGRTIDGIRRSTLSLEMDVADYRLKIERQIGEQRRIEEAGQAAGVVQTTGGRSGVTANSVAGFPITSRQGMRTHPVTGGQKMHAGTDIGTPMNTALAYSMGGVVTKATTLGGYGKILEVKLDNGVTAFAAHLNETLVKAGDKFTARQLLARTGQTGVDTGPHLHMEGNRGGDSTAPLPYLVLNGKASKVAAAAKSSTATQLTEASGKITPRPVVTPNVAGVQAGMGEYNEKNAALRKEALSSEQQLQNLREQAALDNLAAVARGSKEIQQRKDALAYAKADLATIGAASQDKQELLAFEAQSAVKLKLKEDENLKISNQIKANDALTTKQKTDLLGKVQEALDIAKQQIALDKEALVIAQQTRFEKEKTAIQAQLGVTGKGLQAGFIGQAGQAYESEMLKSGNVAQAQALAAQTQALELATTKARALEGAYNDIGSAMASTLTDGVAGLVAGTTTAEQVFVDFLKTLAML